MRNRILVAGLLLASLATSAQVQTFKGDTTGTTSADRINYGATGAGRPGFKGNTGNFQTFALVSEVTAATGGAVTSVNGKAGPSVTITTADVAEGVNKYYTDARSRAAVTVTAPLVYNSSTGAFTFAGTKNDVGLSNLANSLQVINAGGAVSQASGTLAGRPAAGTAGRYYTATDNGGNYFDNGTAWALLEPAITGDVAIAQGTTTSTLATVNSNVGSFGANNSVPVLTVDAKGRITAASAQPITPAAIGAAATATSIFRDNVATYAALNSYTVPSGQTYLLKVATDESQNAPYNTNQWYLKDSSGLTFKMSLIKQ